MKTTPMRHQPVLLKEIMDGLDLTKDSAKNAVYIDCNLGDGGHSQAVIEELGGITVVGFDLDEDAVNRAKTNIAEAVKEKNISFNAAKDLHIFRKNFRTLRKTLEAAGLPPENYADAVLFDLGFSSYEIDQSGRGFSFQKDEPLSMTFGKKLKDGEENLSGDNAFDAADIVNSWKEEDIANVIFAYGEDRYARRIAKKIVESREALQKLGQEEGIRTTKELADIVKRAYPGAGRFGKIHPATKTFQALRIAVNDELRALEDTLPQAFSALKPGGRLAVISFHSLEDRIVKNFFKERARPVDETSGEPSQEIGKSKSKDKSKEKVEGKIITKRPITASDDEKRTNPRSRSAKLRIIEKI